MPLSFSLVTIPFIEIKYLIRNKNTLVATIVVYYTLDIAVR
jgi:hypothetical protein